MGVWLPLALADITALLVCGLRMQAAEPERVKVPRRSETLAGWCLPMLSSSVKAGEDEADARALYDSVKNLAERQKQKEAAK